MDGMTINHIVSIDPWLIWWYSDDASGQKTESLHCKTRRAYPDFQTSWRIWLGGVLGTALSWPFSSAASFGFSRLVAKHDMVSFSEAWDPHDLNPMLRMYRNRIRSGALLALCATVCGTVFLNFGGRPPSSESSPSRGVPQLGPHLQDVPGTRASTEQVSWKRLSCAWLVGNGMRPDMLKLYTFCPRIVIHTAIYEIYWLFPPFRCFHCRYIRYWLKQQCRVNNDDSLLWWRVDCFHCFSLIFVYYICVPMCLCFW